jgi:hypothetical protein
MKYQIWYMKPAHFTAGLTGQARPSAKHLDNTHVLLREIEADGLEAAYAAMQGEIWSPNGEARGLIRSKGLEHTSMSVGDVAVDDVGNVHVVEGHGWLCVGNRRGAP